MLTAGRQKLDGVALLVTIAAGAAAATLAITRPSQTVWVVAAAAAAALVAYSAIRWDIALWAWAWVLSYGMLDTGFWFLEVPGFFNMTIPRFTFLTAVVAFALHFLVRRRPIAFDRGILWMMLALLVYCAISASAHGWKQDSPLLAAPPYYRFIGGMLLPFTIFFLMYNSITHEKQAMTALILLTVFGWYALYVSYLQYAANTGLFAGARSFIWPAYINDPEYGIHFARSRGPFHSATPQSMLLVVLFYVDLYLVRKIRGPYRAMLIIQALLILPGIFFCGLRAAYIRFLACGLVWIIWASRHTPWLKVAGAVVVLLAGVYAFWGNLASTDRATGGMAQRGPVADRVALAQATWEMTKVRPFIGAGYGRFAEARYQFERDPTFRALPPALMQHNLFFSVLGETGVIGTALLVGVFILVFKESLALYRKIPDNAQGVLCRALVVLFWVVFTNYLVGALFVDVTIDFFGTGMTWTFAGMMVGYNRLLEPHLIDVPVHGSAGRETSVVTG